MICPKEARLKLLTVRILIIFSAKILILVGVTACLSLFTCKKDDTKAADVSVYLQDAPAMGYDKIKIEHKELSVYSQTSVSWVNLTANNGIFDLLTLDSLHQAFLGKLKISEGDITQVQLTIGSQNSVTVGGISHPLILNASDLDKLKVKIGHTVNGSSSYKLTIDFKAFEHVPMVKPSGSFGFYSPQLAAEIELGACSEVNTIYSIDDSGNVHKLKASYLIVPRSTFAGIPCGNRAYIFN
jgi:hypothetical protein